MGLCTSNRTVSDVIESPVEGKYIFRGTLSQTDRERVVSAVDTTTNEHCAIKIMNHTSKNETIFNRQVQILEYIDHPNCIRYHTSAQDDRYLYIMVELCRGDNLFEHILTPSNQLTEDAISNQTYNMLTSLKYLHDLDIVHRNIRPDSFIFRTKQNECLVLTDFYSSILVDDKSLYPCHAFNRENCHCRSPESLLSDNDRLRAASTASYVSDTANAFDRDFEPVEISGALLKKSDLWSIGIVVYMMIFGRPPFDGMRDDQTVEQIVNEAPEFSGDVDVSDQCLDFISKCLNKNAEERMTVDDALAHVWIESRRTIGESDLEASVSKVSVEKAQENVDAPEEPVEIDSAEYVE